jgi:hypothetical protein
MTKVRVIAVGIVWKIRISLISRFRSAKIDFKILSLIIILHFIKYIRLALPILLKIWNLLTKESLPILV